MESCSMSFSQAHSKSVARTVCASSPASSSAVCRFAELLQTRERDDGKHLERRQVLHFIDGDAAVTEDR